MAIRRFDNVPMPQGPARGALAMAMVNPLEDTLSAIERFGQRGAVASAEQQATNDVLSGGNPGMSLGLTPAGQAYNEAARKAYLARTEGDLRAKALEVGNTFTGRNQGDAQAAAKVFGAHVEALSMNVPDSVKPQLMAEAKLRQADLVARIASAENQNTFRMHVSEIDAGLQADVDEASVMARDGSPPEAIGAIYQRADSRIDDLVNLGQINAAEAEIRKAEYRSGIQAEAIYGQALRDGSGVRVLHDLDTGGPVSQGLTLKQRDSLKAKLTAELNRREADAQRADAEQARVGKVEREVAATQMWAAVYSPESDKRPTTDTIVNAQRAGILSASDAEQMIRTLATSKEARTDLPTLAAIEQAAADGVDVTGMVNDGIRAGKIAWADAGALFERNKAAQSDGLPNPVKAARDGVLAIYRETSPFGAPNPGEQERQVDALAWFDEQVRAAPEGKDPATGLPFSQLAAEQALATITTRHRGQQAAKLVKLPPRGAVTVPAPAAAGFGAPPMLDVAATVAKLKADKAAGLMTEAEYLGEMKLVKRWIDAGLVTK